MNNELDKFNVEIRGEELEEKIRQYYSSQDETISEVDVKYSTDYIEGQWNEAWQYHMGGYIKMRVKVKITRLVKILGEDRIIKNDIDLDEKEIKDILTELFKSDNLKVESIYPSIFHKDLVYVKCKKLVDENKTKDTKRINGNNFSQHVFYKRNRLQEKANKIIQNLFN